MKRKKGWHLTNHFIFKKPKPKEAQQIKANKDVTYCRLKSAGHEAKVTGQSICLSKYKGGNIPIIYT
jgi:hypothetical protein